MEVAFADKAFRDICLNELRAKHAFGEPLAEKLKSRLADIAAVSNVADLLALPGRPKELTDARWDQMAVSLINQHQLVFKSGHTKEYLLASGRIDWAHVRRVKILGMEKGDE